jgi:hypothetical protein
MKRGLIFALGAAATLACGALWHGPLGAGERVAVHAEKIARATLDYYELPAVNARLERAPLSRRMILSGPADAFQRSELVRIMGQVPGVNEVRWDPASLPQEARR